MFGLTKPQSKAQAGAKLAQLQNQAPDSIPGMFKPGEFVLPPDTVHAMGGKQALQSVVDATHTPVQPSFGLNAPSAPEGPQAKAAPQMGFKPEVFFANGGAPEDQLAKRAPVSPSNIFPQASPSAGANIYAGAGVSRDQLGSSVKLAQVPAGIGGNPDAPARPASQPAAPKPNSFGDAAAVSNTAGVTQVSPTNIGQSPATAASAPAQAPAAAPRLPGASELYMQDRAQEMGDQWSAGNYAQAVGTAGRTAVQGLGMYGLELADKTLTPAANAVGGFAKGLFGIGDAQAAPAPASASTAKVTPAVSDQAAPAAGYTQKSQGVMGPPDLSPLSGQTAVPGAAQAGGAAIASQLGSLPAGVYSHGRGQYSDQASGMSFAPGFTGQPNAQNQRAAAGLAAMNSPMLAEQQGGVPTQTAPAVAHSGNDWAARQRLKNMETSASSIMNTQRWGGKNALQNPAVQNFIDAQRADLAAQGKVPDLQLKTNEINAGLHRAAMAEAGADRRSQAQLGLGMGQLALGAQRNQLDAQRINSDERLRAPQIRAAERLGQMQEAFISAKTPQEKAEIAAQIRAYNGKLEEDRWKAVALQGGTDAQGNKTESLLGAVNERTGEMRRMGQGSPALPPGMTKQVGTSGGKPVYEDANGKRYVGS